MFNVKKASVTGLIAMLALVSLPAMAKETVLGLIKQDARHSGMNVAWELDVDWLLESDQVKALEVVPEGDTGYLAGKAIDLVRKGSFVSQLDPSARPVVFECPTFTVVVTTAAAGKSLKKNCTQVSNL
ncbi:hypothetical protein [Pseudomonas sp. PLMAX]|uniref:hypothetical protein n=1 Tax=Pseudomonas sp. PLMAX TaxID=2201998 RepID=UPI0038BA0E99